MSRSTSPSTAALGLMALGTVLFSTMNVFARLATTSASWTSVAAARSIVGALVAFAVARHKGLSLRPTNARLIFWRSFFGSISMLSTFYALSSKSVSLGDTVTLLNLAPVFLALLAPIFLQERTTGGVAIAIAVSLGGVALVVRPSFLFGSTHLAVVGAGSGPSVSVTMLVATFAALATSIAMMMLRRVGRTESPEAIAFHFSLFAAAVNTLLSLFDLRMPTVRDALFMIGAGICAGFGQLAMTRAYSLESAARVGGMSYLSVVASSILGVLFLGEHPEHTAIIGMALVVAGGLLVTFANSKRATAVT